MASHSSPVDWQYQLQLLTVRPGCIPHTRWQSVHWCGHCAMAQPAWHVCNAAWPGPCTCP